MSKYKLIYIIDSNIECIPDLVNGDYSFIKKYDTQEFRKENRENYKHIKIRGEIIFFYQLSVLISPCSYNNEIPEILAEYFYRELFSFLVDTKKLDLVQTIKFILELMYISDDNGDYLPHIYFKKGVLLEFLNNIIYLSENVDDYINIQNNDKDSILNMMIKQDFINEDLMDKLLAIGSNVLLTDINGNNIIDLMDGKISDQLKEQILKRETFFLRKEIKNLKESNSLLENKLGTVIKFIQAFDIEMLKKLSIFNEDIDFTNIFN